jgi:hypothetical protein
MATGAVAITRLRDLTAARAMSVTKSAAPDAPEVWARERPGNQCAKRNLPSIYATLCPGIAHPQ